MADRDEEVARGIALRHNDVGVTRALIDDIATALRQAREEGRREAIVARNAHHDRINQILNPHGVNLPTPPGDDK